MTEGEPKIPEFIRLIALARGGNCVYGRGGIRPIEKPEGSENLFRINIFPVDTDGDQSQQILQNTEGEEEIL